MVWERKPAPDDLICPACLTVYQRREIPPDQPTCPECGSEAADIDLIPYRRLLRNHPWTISNGDGPEPNPGTIYFPASRNT